MSCCIDTVWPIFLNYINTSKITTIRGFYPNYDYCMDIALFNVKCSLQLSVPRQFSSQIFYIVGFDLASIHGSTMTKVVAGPFFAQYPFKACL